MYEPFLILRRSLKHLIPKKCICQPISGLCAAQIRAKSRSVETFWRHDVPWSWRCFSAHEKGPFPRACHSFAASVHWSLLSTHMVPLALDKHSLDSGGCVQVLGNTDIVRIVPARIGTLRCIMSPYLRTAAKSSEVLGPNSE